MAAKNTEEASYYWLPEFLEDGGEHGPEKIHTESSLSGDATLQRLQAENRRLRKALFQALQTIQKLAPVSVPRSTQQQAPKKRECAGTGVFLPPLQLQQMEAHYSQAQGGTLHGGGKMPASGSSGRFVGAGPSSWKKHVSSPVPKGRHALAAVQPKYNGFRSETSAGGMVDKHDASASSSQRLVDEFQLPEEWTY